jgi:hypothetical protein
MAASLSLYIKPSTSSKDDFHQVIPVSSLIEASKYVKATNRELDDSSGELISAIVKNKDRCVAEITPSGNILVDLLKK